MSKRYKKCVVFFRASKEIEIPIDSDPQTELINQIQLDISDKKSDLRYEGGFVLAETVYECRECLEFFEGHKIYKDDICFDCYEETNKESECA